MSVQCIVVDCLFYNHFLCMLNECRSQFPEVIGYLQPIKDLILSEENVQVYAV